MPTYQEIQEQIAKLQAEAEKVRKAEIATVIADIKSKMATYGITLADLQGVKQGSRAEVKPKYRDPASGNTWSGRGLKPKWLTEAIAKGKTLDSFLI